MSTGALTAIVVVETIVLALLAVLVVSLLRSHAEVLRRLPAPDDEHEHDHTPEPSTPVPIALEGEPALPTSLPPPKRRATEAHDVAGITLGGDHVAVSAASGSDTLFAFLSTGCLTCRTFWDGLQPASASRCRGMRG